MRIIHTTAAAALVLATSLVGAGAWAHGNTGATNTTTHKGATTGATQQQGAGKLSASDHQFFRNAYSDATAELAIGQLAANQGATDPVKKLGQTMVKDSTKQLDDLRGFAQQNNITPPSGMNTKDQGEVGRLSKLQGQKFDAAFLQHVQSRERTVLGEMEREGKDSKNAQLKSWAQGQVAILRSHVDQARNIGVAEKQQGATQKQPGATEKQPAPGHQWAPKKEQPKQP